MLEVLSELLEFYVELKLLICKYRPTTATAAWCHISVVLPCPSSWVELEIMELGFLPGHLEFSYLWQRHKPCGQLFVRDETILPSSFGYYAQQACTTEIGAAHSTERFQPDLGEYSLNKFAFN